MACTELPKELDAEAKERIEAWLEGPYDEETKADIRRLLQENPAEANAAFYTTLGFGTGGLRGVMGPGTNRMNAYTVRNATQGLANYLKTQVGDAQEASVFIGYDCRHQSDAFALEAARVLAGNGIRAYLCNELRPTPFVSFGCRYHKCQAAIMITASHNPPEYNGYKVYWSDGGQIVPPHDTAIIEEVKRITHPNQVSLANADSEWITYVDAILDEAYLKTMSELRCNPIMTEKSGEHLHIVFTNLHGTGGTLVPAALKRWGFTHVETVASQDTPDGDFPTVESPNPEERAALDLGIQQLQESKADILFGCDPDADRMGLAVMHQGQPVLLNGNQIACLALAYLCEETKLPERAAFVKTIVTSELFQAIAAEHDTPCFNVLTGFKYIADLIRRWEESTDGYEYVFGGEESYGYLLGTFVRDKDAVVSCCLLAEVALHCKLQGKTLVDRLHEIYAKYGTYREDLYSLKFPETKEGREQMASSLDALRSTPPTEFAGVKVVAIEDYQTSIRTEVVSGAMTPIDLPSSNVLLYWLEDESKLVVRPSGTEPKVKFYCGVVSHNHDVQAAIVEADAKLEGYIGALKHALA